MINIAKLGTVSGPVIRTISPYKTYGVKIDTTNSNPETSVTYTDDAVGMIPGNSDDWNNTELFQNVRPCLLKDGAVQYYLDKNNYTLKEDGTASDITTGNDGDVMVEFPKVATAIYTEGTDLFVKVSTDPYKPLEDSRFTFNAHTRIAQGDRNKLYVGAYHGWVDASNKLRSLSGKTPTTNQTIGTFRTRAQVNGSGYDQLMYYPLMLLQCLYLIKYKSLNSQVALGRGYVDGNSSSIITGGTNAKGMDFGETTGKQQMKFCGIEDFWGNVLNWVDGLVQINSGTVATATSGFNDTGSGYVSQATYGASVNGYITKVQGNNDLGFLTTTGGGSETTYFCDFGYFPVNVAVRFPQFGGSWDSGANAGAFLLRLSGSATSVGSYFGARAGYL